MRLFMGLLATETNSFAPIPTGWAAFRDGGIAHDDASSRPESTIGVMLAEWRRLAEGDGIDVIEGLAASAPPAGPTLRGVYEELRDTMLAQVKAALPLDIVLLNLHGAMVAEGYDDCEGDLLTRIRALTGPDTVIGGELDLHCHLTDAMLGAADALIAYKEYPHTDEIERGRELYALCRDAARGLVRPVTRVFDPRMMGMWHTSSPRMRAFVEAMQAAEGVGGILSVSFGHGFSWGDVPAVGARMWAIADGDAQLAEATARDFGLRLYKMREAVRPHYATIDEALDQVGAAPGLLVLADVADNPGGGAASDSSFLLSACLDRGLTGVTIGGFCDPQAAALCAEAGEGAVLPLRLGGKVGPASGDPVDLLATVRAVRGAHSQSGLSGDIVQMGLSVWIEAAGLDLLIVSRREQVFSPDIFTGIGMPLEGQAAAIVKSTQHFHAGFAPIARAIVYVSTPGAIMPDHAAIPYTKRDGNFWPRVADPLGLDG